MTLIQPAVNYIIRTGSSLRKLKNVSAILKNDASSLKAERLYVKSPVSTDSVSLPTEAPVPNGTLKDGRGDG